MSEAKSAQKRLPSGDELAQAVLALFELLVANATARGDDVERPGDWADEFKPRLERLIRNGTRNSPQLPQE